MIGPIVIGLVLGLREVARVARRSPHRISLALIIVAAGASVVWLTPPGAWLRTAIVGNHYGDSQRLVSTIGDAIIVLAAAGAAIELLARLSAAGFGPARAGAAGRCRRRESARADRIAASPLCAARA